MPQPYRTGNQRGFSLVEVLVATMIACVVAIALYLLTSSTMDAWSWVETSMRVHTRWLAFRETFSRDVQHASSVVKEITLDESRYTTTLEPPQECLILRLPAMGPSGRGLPGIFDFVVYAVTPQGDQHASMHRQLFTTRAANGDPVIGIVHSLRTPASLMVMDRFVRSSLPPERGKSVSSDIFTIDPEEPATTRTVSCRMGFEAPGMGGRATEVVEWREAMFRFRGR